MHINEDISTLYSGKLPRVLLTGSPKSLIVPVKSNIQMDRETVQPSNSTSSEIQNTLVKYQCQKWQQFLDFDKILEQIRVTEKQHLRNKHELLHTLSNGGKNEVSPNIIRSSSKFASLSSMKCARPLRQVQRLNGNDMHYYGIAPYQTALNAVICNMCFGIYTKVGFNNHMMMRHSSAWNAVPANLHTTPSHNEAYDVTSNVNQNIIDNATNLTITAEIVESSSDLSATISNSSNASSYSPLHTLTQRHKNIKSESVAGINSSNSNCARLRNKHIKYKSNSPLSEFKTTNLDSCQMLSKKIKKSCNINSVNVVTISPIISRSINDNFTSLVNRSQPSATYSSSSNSSCSLPPTPQMGVNQLEIKSPSIISQESADSLTSNSSNEFDRTTSISKSISTKVSNVSNFGNNVKPHITTTIGTTKKIRVKNVDFFEPCELDQKVSSITESQENKKKAFECFKDIDRSNNSPPNSFHMKSSYTINNVNKSNSCTNISSLLLQSIVPQEVAESRDEIVTHNNSDDNSILTLDDVLDSKFINEILSSTESEMHFDENELEGASTHQQTYSQLSAKRMRFDETVVTLQQEHVSDIITNFTAFPNQYAQYNVANMDNIKIYNRTQQMSIDAQEHHQEQDQSLSTIHAMQIQQLLYQQQNFHSYENNVDHTSSSTLHDQQQFEQNSFKKHLTNICSTDDIYKSNLSTIPSKLTNLNSIATNYNIYESVNYGCDVMRNFQLFNIPSLTDNICELPDVLVHDIANGVHRNPQQFVLKNNDDHPIYDIADNNQATVLSHQRKKQILVNFFNKTNTDHIHQLNSGDIHQNNILSNIAHSSTLISTIAKNDCNNSFDFQDADFSHIESVKTISVKNCNNINDGHAYCKVVYFNVFIYAEVPRPISINCFGLIKLPFSTAAAFKKHLLSTRKANNNPIILSGGLSGVIGPNSRVSHSKSFSNISNTNGSVTNAFNNEFSIGSVTITSLTTPYNQIYPQHKQYGTTGLGATVEMILNNNLQSSVISPMLTLQRQKSKSNTSNTSINATVSNYVRSKSQANIVASTATPYNRYSARTSANYLLQNCKTIHIYNSTTNTNDKVQYVRGSVFIACKPDVPKKSRFASRQIVDILGGTNKAKLFKCKHLSQPKFLNSAECAVDELRNLGQAKNFFQHRRKIVDLSIKCRHIKNY